MAKSPEEYAHLEWLGYVQPLGLVVSIPAMLEAQCQINKNIMGEHARFLGCLPREDAGEIIPEIRDLSEFTRKVLEWETEDFKEVPQRVALTGDMASLEVVLPQYHETLRPTHAVPAFRPKEDENPWMMLVQELETGTDLDKPNEADSAKHWNAAPQAKFERLLRETQVPIGLLSNGQQLRLVYSPRGETSGHATFNVDEMVQVAGRPMFAALHMLLCGDRMFTLGEKQRLPAILQNSRKYQNTVSTALAEQVLAALYELMRGFQAANDVRKGELLRDVLADDPNHVYAGLLRVLMRLVFVMYAEDRDLLSSDPVYSNHYSVTGLFNRLREDAGRFPDTMNQRFGAWSQLITLFRLIYEGGQHNEFKLPPRKGYLFDPDRYPFLEGRQRDANQDDGVPSIPRISDGVVFNVLQNLLILDGERLSYRTLDVEQIGSVYETVMGFNLEVAQGKSIAIKPVKSHGAPATINLEELLTTAGKDRAKWLKDQSDQKVIGVALNELKAAETIEELLTALDKKIKKTVTPRVVPAGAIVLQPSDERRRSGSHYTPRSLTEPIVRTTLEPILKQLVDAEADPPAVYEPSREDNRRYTPGELQARIRLSEKAVAAANQARQIGTPHPAQILDLKICDPAMGSGAFLVETCRQLGDELIKAWYAHDLVPTDIPPDEDEVLYARRLVAQRCLYGVDKNAMAVDLAKLSLWLVTLAKDHPFTFLDHSLRHGDSLVGLTREQIIGFHWEPKKQKAFGEDLIQRRLDRATEARAKILNAREDVTYRDQESRMALADEALNVVRMTGDACVSAFFAGSKKKEREDRCEDIFASVSQHYQNLKDDKLDTEVRSRIAAAASELQSGEHPIPPFHWEIEFPEVFARENGGFDAFVGNPPFAGKNTMKKGNRSGYPDWLKSVHVNSHGNSDLVAHFFRLAFLKVRECGTTGLVATNTISQGDTRHTGLRWICTNESTIYAARKRLRWPGDAAVVVSVVHTFKGVLPGPFKLDGAQVDLITAYLLKSGGHESPLPLESNKGIAFQGSILLGMGFTFDDTDTSGVVNPLSEMEAIVADDPESAARIAPYIGGDEVNNVPDHAHYRFAINFADFPLRREQSDDQWCDLDVRQRKQRLRTGIVPLDYPDSVAADWPALLNIVEQKVKPVRQTDNREIYRRLWWQFGEKRIDLYVAIRSLPRVLAINCGATPYMSFTFLPADLVFANTLDVIVRDDYGSFCMLQCRVHEVWARRESSSMKDDLRYTPTDVFDTFPFPDSLPNVWHEAGEQYFATRASIMMSNGLGLTKTYNRFHDPHEKSSEIATLRELHEAMDRAVLEAYGWDDLAQTARCEFLLDYEEEEDEDSAGKKKSNKKKPWRLRWPDEFRDEVLARLLELNEERHQEELLAGASEPQRHGGTVKGKRGKQMAKLLPLFAELDRDERIVLLIVQYFGLMTRRAVDEAFVAMRSPKLRKSRLGLGEPPKTIPRTDTGRDALIGGLIEQGYLAKHPSEIQQVLKIGTVKPSLGKVTSKDKDALEETKAIFQRAIDDSNSDMATCNKGVTDARPGLVSSA